MTNRRSRYGWALPLIIVLGCAAPSEQQPVADALDDHGPRHLEACDKPGPERPFSDRDEQIYTVVTYSPDDREGALREMAEKFEISIDEARSAFARVMQARANDWEARSHEARFACFAEQHGLRLIEMSAASSHVTVFVDASELAVDEFDRFAEDLLLLGDVQSVTAQLHLNGEPKIRRDYPVAARR